MRAWWLLKEGVCTDPVCRCTRCAGRMTAERRSVYRPSVQMYEINGPTFDDALLAIPFWSNVHMMSSGVVRHWHDRLDDAWCNKCLLSRWAETGYTSLTRQSLFPRSCSATDAVGALQNVWILTKLWKQHSVQTRTETRGASAPDKNNKNRMSRFKRVWFYIRWRKQRGQLWKKHLIESELHFTSILPFEHQRKTAR